MSEPPLKKKRTILDFFSGKGNKKSRGEGKKVDVMASAASAVDKNSSSGAKTKVTDDEVPGTSTADTHVEETIVINDFDSEDTLKDIPTKKPSQCKAGSQAWKGIPLKILDKLTDMDENLGPLQGTDNHRVLFKTPFKYDGVKPPTPFPTYKDKWDTNYVRMPCSNLSEYPTTGKDGGPKVLRRWDMIQEALLADIPGPYELEEKILSYNSRYFGKWNFNVLHSFFVENIDNAERNHFFNDTLKKMATLALQLPHLCTAPIPLLKCNRNFSVTLSQQQIACLLANAFFCTFPRRNAKSRTSEYIRYPNINFNSLFMGQPSYVKFEKLRCIIHYFNRIFKKMPCGTVTFTRQCIPQDKMPNWENDDTPLRGLHVSSEGTIEDDGLGLLQADFANMYLGGGVLGNGCVQEEIRFLICPEMIVSRLFTECLNKNECLIMRGCERFSNYDGYAAKFEWKENYIDTTPRDSWGRIKCEVTAIDALVIHDFRSQFQIATVKRELNKAYCGFAYLGKKTTDTLPAVCTGNWGCGAFGGDKQLKALIQLMAAAKAGRDLCYFTFDDEGLRDQIFAVHKYLTSDNMLRIVLILEETNYPKLFPIIRGMSKLDMGMVGSPIPILVIITPAADHTTKVMVIVSVPGDLLKLIEQYRRNVLLKSRYKPALKLFGYIRSVFDGGLEDTGSEDSSQSLEMQRLDQEYNTQEEAEMGSEEFVEEGDNPDGTSSEKTALQKQDSLDYKALTP